jgi:hypothetical protein
MPKRTATYDRWLREKLNDPVVAMNYLKAATAESAETLRVAKRDVAAATRPKPKKSRRPTNRRREQRLARAENKRPALLD